MNTTNAAAPQSASSTVATTVARSAEGTTLGYVPSATEVADLIAAVLRSGLLAEVDRQAMSSILAALHRGQMTSDAAYRELLTALQRGGTADLALGILDALFGSGDVIELRAVGLTGGAVSYCGRLGKAEEREQLAAFIREHNGSRNVYFGINPRAPGLANTGRSAKAEDVVARHHVVLDLDLKDAPSSDPDWALTLTELDKLNPEMVVSSGNGWHVWFPIEVVTGGDLASSVAPLAAAMKALGADNIADLPRPIRVPGTINIPNVAKRRRGADLALARVLKGPQPTTLRSVVALAEVLVQAAQALGNATGAAVVAEAATATSASARTALPQEARWAPSAELLSALLELLPNTEKLDRDDFVDVAHMVWGASRGTNFEADAREAFLDWAARWTEGGDADEDERIFDTIRSSYMGWSHLLGLLLEHNSAGHAQILDMLQPLRSAEARAAFANAQTEQATALGIDLTNSDAYGSGTVAALPLEDANPKQSLAARAMAALVGAGRAEFFRSPDNKLWISLAGRIHRIDEAKGCRPAHSWLLSHGVTVTGNAKGDLKDQMIARAFAGPTHEVHYRQANGPDRAAPEAFLNLMDRDMGIRMSPKGWRVAPLSTFPVRMTDREQALALPKPVRANDGVGFLERLTRHVKLAPVGNPNDPLDLGVQQRAAVLMFLVAQLFRSGAVPHILISGPQGASKTTTARRLKSLVDPDPADVVTSFPEKEAEIFAIAEQQTVIVTDNLSRVRNPDVMAALSTGAAGQGRELYTNGGRALFRAKTSVVMTTVLAGITKRPDLLDRTLRLDLPSMNSSERRTEDELLAAWTAELPHLLADLLDLVCGGMARLPMVHKSVETGLLPPLPRLADAALIAEAVAEAAGWAPGGLLNAVNAMRGSEQANQLEEDPVAARIKALLDAQGGRWTGTTQELFDLLWKIDGPAWLGAGSSVQAFTSALDRVAGSLLEFCGIAVERSRSHGKRVLTLSRVRH